MLYVTPPEPFAALVTFAVPGCTLSEERNHTSNSHTAQWAGERTGEFLPLGGVTTVLSRNAKLLLTTPRTRVEELPNRRVDRAPTAGREPGQPGARGLSEAFEGKK